jgi:hypothetical protein
VDQEPHYKKLQYLFRVRNTLVLWTIHPEYFFVKSKKRGYIKGDGRYIDHNFKDKYDWVAEKMLEKSITRKRTYPVWAWYKYDGKRKKPDLRCSGHLPRGTKGICIEFEAYKNEMLLSNFEQWHSVLNNWYLCKNEAEDAYFEKYPQLLTETVVRKSWDRMFDLSFGSEDFWGPMDERWIQACVPIVYNHQIRNVFRFVAR